MKFTLNNDYHKSRLMNSLLSGLLLFSLFFLSADLVLKSDHYGYTPEQISTMVYGDADEFIEPIPFISLLEGLHADIFFAMMSLLTLGAIYGRVGRSKTLRIVLINIMMFSALVSLAAPLMVYFISGKWIVVWMASFIIWHASAFFIAIISFFRLKFP